MPTNIALLVNTHRVPAFAPGTPSTCIAIIFARFIQLSLIRRRGPRSYYSLLFGFLLQGITSKEGLHVAKDAGPPGSTRGRC